MKWSLQTEQVLNQAIVKLHDQIEFCTKHLPLDQTEVSAHIQGLNSALDIIKNLQADNEEQDQ